MFLRRPFVHPPVRAGIFHQISRIFEPRSDRPFMLSSAIPAILSSHRCLPFRTQAATSSYPLSIETTSTSLIKVIRRAQVLQKARQDSHFAVNQLILRLLEDYHIGCQQSVAK
nr:chaperone protein ClpB1-like [Ipomoea batatas]